VSAYTHTHTHTHARARARAYNEDMKLLLHTGRMNFMFFALCILI